jgi:DNA helicase-2/ATP-dependent DNA helicase PcrA
VLVDEVQDVNRLQADLMLALQPDGRGLTAVGDDAQSIYAFRGADVRHILDLPARFDPPAQVLTLERNYRSTPQVLAASNAVIALAAERFAKTLWTDRAAACRPRLHTVADEAAQARGVADAVLAEREAGILLRRQAVLFRTSTHSAPLELELTRRGVPFVKYGGSALPGSRARQGLALRAALGRQPGSRLAAQRVARLVPGMGPASVARLLAHGGPLEAFKPPPAAAAPWQRLVVLMAAVAQREPRWPADLAWPWPGTSRTWNACTTTPACAGPTCSSCSTSPAATPAASASSPS